MKSRGAKRPAFIDQLKGGQWSRKTSAVRLMGPPPQRLKGHRAVKPSGLGRKFGRKQ